MDFSFRYTAEDTTVTLPAGEYVARFRDAERIGGYCRTCPEYGRSWGCPPLGFDVEACLAGYASALLVATQITPSESGIPLSEAQRLILPERRRLEGRLLEMERLYGGRSFAYVGTCLHCPEGTCIPKENRAATPSWFGRRSKPADSTSRARPRNSSASN